MRFFQRLAPAPIATQQGEMGQVDHVASSANIYIVRGRGELNRQSQNGHIRDRCLIDHEKR